jgi:hypothetical protein
MYASMQVVFYSICGLYYFDGPYRIKRILVSGRAGRTFRVHLFFCHQKTQTLEGAVVIPAAAVAAAAAASVVFRYYYGVASFANIRSTTRQRIVRFSENKN